MRRSKKLDIAKQMPTLRHAIPGREFDITESEVAKWLCSQSEIMQHVFDTVSQPAYGHKSIVYDPESGTWHGREYRAPLIETLP